MLRNPIYRSAIGRLRYLTLLADWRRAQWAKLIDPRIPHPSINYNQAQAASFDAYCTGFAQQASECELPALLDIAGFSNRDARFVMLDYGCGLGRLALAFTELFGDVEDRRYIGYEIHPDAVTFLRKAYGSFSNVSILSDRLQRSESYVEIQQGGTAAGIGVAAERIQLSERLDEEIDLAFSHSVFTHMHREPIVHVLSELQRSMAADGICVNTWLLVDREAESNLATGKADRALPFRQDGYWTYDLENPLVCTAYNLSVVESIYEVSGHDIIEIRWGTWSGRAATQDFTYQDVVISRPRRTPL